MLLWITVATLAALGAALLWRGLRGKRLNDHPICRRCKFDLVGLSGVAQLSELCATRPTSQQPQINTSDDSPSTHSSESCATINHCPECGRDLQRKRAVRIGARKKRPIAITIGALLTFIAISIPSAWGWGRANSFNWNTIKPDWLLHYEALGKEENSARAALTELHARVAAGSLHKRRLDTLIEHGLSAQQDWSQSWAPEWGSIIESAWKNKSVSEEQFGRYLQQSTLIRFPDDRSTIPTSVAQSRLAEITNSKYAGESIWIPSAMFSRGAVESSLIAQPVLQWVELDGARIDTDEHMHRISSLSSGGSNVIGPLRFENPGTHQIRAEWRIRVFDSQTQRRSWGSAMSKRDEDGNFRPVPPSFSPSEQFLLAEFDIVAEGEFTVEPARIAQSVQLISDPGLRRQVVDAISISFTHAWRTKDQFFFTCTRSVKPLPVALSFSAVLTDGENEWPFGPLIVPPGGEPIPAVMPVVTPISKLEFKGRAITVKLRPDPKAVELRPEFKSIWGEEIVIADIPFEWAAGHEP